MDIFDGQTQPLTLMWAADGTGNPFDLTEAEKAATEVSEMKAKTDREKNKVLKEAARKR